jgi:hypothetical protein
MEGDKEGIEQAIGGGGEVREEVEQPVEVTMEQLEEIQQTGEPVEKVIQHSYSHPDEAQREGETTEPEATPAPVEVTMEQLEEIQQTGEPVEEIVAQSASPHQVEEEEKEEDLSFPAQVVTPVDPGASSEEAAVPLPKAPGMMEREIVPEPEPVVEEGPKELRVDGNKYTLVISGHRYSTSNFWFVSFLSLSLSLSLFFSLSLSPLTPQLPTSRHLL